MSTTDMAYDMTDSQTQAHVRQIFASCHVLKSVSCRRQLQPLKTSRSKPKRRSSPAMPLLRRCVVFMALVVAMPPEGGPAAPPGGPSAPPGPSACPGSGGPAPPPGGGPGADPATLNALAGLWSFLARPPPPASPVATGGVATAKAAPPNAPGTSMPPPGTVPVTGPGPDAAPPPWRRGDTPTHTAADTPAPLPTTTVPGPGVVVDVDAVEPASSSRPAPTAPLTVDQAVDLRVCKVCGRQTYAGRGVCYYKQCEPRR